MTNCSQCNMPLQPGARFCASCGAPVRSAGSDGASTSSTQASMEETQRVYPLPPQHVQPPTPSNAPTRPMGSGEAQPPPFMRPIQPTMPVPNAQNTVSPSPMPAPLSYYQANQSQTGAKMFPATVNAQAQPASGTAQRLRRGAGCVGCLTVVVLLLFVVGAGWTFAVRPYIHSIAQNQLDNAMSNAVQQIPPQAAQLPAGSTIPVQESTLTNMIVLNLA